MLHASSRTVLAVLLAMYCATPARAGEDDPARSVTLPADDAAHDNQAIEWWYYTAHLHTCDGKRYGVQLVFFQFPLDAEHLGSATTFAVTDLNGAEPQFAQESLSQPVGFPATPGSIDLRLATDTRLLSASGRNGHDHLQAELSGYAIDLELDSQKPPALHGDDGIVSFPSGDDHYYSRTRMAVRGTLKVRGEPLQVTGVAWFDHQYGAQPAVSWTWFSVQLSSREELMVYHWFTPAGDRSSTLASFVSRGGKTRNLQADQVALTQLDTWLSPTTNIAYGKRWRIRIAAEELDLTITSRLPGSELLPPGQLPYIEADSDVSGTRKGKPVHGYAFAEQVFQPDQ